MFSFYKRDLAISGI